MANINAETGTVVVAGSTSDDQITLADGIATNGGIDGNGGSDTLTLSNTTDTFVLLAGGLTYTAATDTWAIAGQALIEGFTSVTLSDGVTVEAGVASEGIIQPAAVASGASANLGTINSYDWDGAAASVNAFTATSIVSVDGQDIATAGSNFVNTDGAFNVSGTGVTFTANTAAIAAQGNVGDKASFSYEVVVANADGSETRTVTVTYEQDIPFTTGDDTWNAGTGADANVTENVSGGDDTFNGNDEINNITAADGDDTIFGGNNNDILEGGNGNDFIRGGNGNDTITVGTGTATDANNLGGGAGADNITGGAGNDTIFGGGGDDAALNGGGGNDVINGGAGNDVLTGNAGNDTLKGGDGDDHLIGTEGANELRGGAGKDNVDGGSGADMIYTSLGGDDLNGGAGNDTFVLKAGTGNTTIEDFRGAANDENDKLNVEELGYNNLADVLAVSYETGTAVVIEIDADTTVTLTGETLAGLSAADFDFA